MKQFERKLEIAGTEKQRWDKQSFSKVVNSTNDCKSMMLGEDEQIKIGEIVTV